MFFDFEKIKLTAITFVLLLLFSFSFLGISAKATDNSSDNSVANDHGLSATAKSAGLNVDGENGDVNIIIGKVIGAALSLIGIVFFGLMIYGGFMWMTAHGNEQDVEKAKNLIIAAIIGLLIVLSAYAITSFVGGVLGQKSSA